MGLTPPPRRTLKPPLLRYANQPLLQRLTASGCRYVLLAVFMHAAPRIPFPLALIVDSRVIHCDVAAYGRLWTKKKLPGSWYPCSYLTVREYGVNTGATASSNQSKIGGLVNIWPLSPPPGALYNRPCCSIPLSDANQLPLQRLQIAASHESSPARSYP